MLSVVADQAPGLARGQRLHLRQGEQHLVGHRVLRGGGAARPPPAPPRPRRVRRTARRRPSATRSTTAPPTTCSRASTPSAPVDRLRAGQRGGLGDRGERLDRRTDVVRARCPSRGRTTRSPCVSRSSTRPVVSPSSRPMSAVDRAARWASSSTLRCWSGRWWSASRTAFCSALMPFSRCQRRATWRRWAIAHARGAHPLLGVGEPADLAPVVPRPRRTRRRHALRAAARSPVSA